MSGEWIVVIGILGGIAAMVVVLLLYQRGKERRLAAQAEIEIPVMSIWRSVVVGAVSLVTGPIGFAVFGALSGPPVREHAAAIVLATLAGCGLLIPLGLRLGRGWRRIGLLRYTADELTLDLGGERCVLDLRQPFAMAEASAEGPGGMTLQVLGLRQGDREWGFSYGLPIRRKAYGDVAVPRYLTPLLDAETRVIHDRLRALFDRS